MAELSDGPVGIRWQKTQVLNSVRDQRTVIDLLARIGKDEGGMAHLWETQPLAGPAGVCPAQVATAIRAFQTQWVARGILRLADGVVDPGGASLRQMNLLIERRKPSGVIDEPAVKTQDVVIALTAFGHRNVDGAAYARRKLDSPQYKAKTNRELIVVSEFGTSGFDGFNLASRVFDPIGSNPALKLGKVFLYGVSIGGRCAVFLAQALNARGIKPYYVGLSDAAFFDNETVAPPVPGTSMKPLIKPFWSSFRSTLSVDAFQIRGNSWKPASHGRMWWSEMLHGEIHGPVQGFARHWDLTPYISASSHPNDAHVEAARLGEDKILFDIFQILTAV